MSLAMATSTHRAVNIGHGVLQPHFVSGTVLLIEAGVCFRSSFNGLASGVVNPSHLQALDRANTAEVETTQWTIDYAQEPSLGTAKAAIS